MNPVETFFAVWEREAQKTVEMLNMLPAGQYDVRPDTSGRSLGELAWHLAELDAYISFGIANGAFSQDAKPPNIKRPMTIDALAPGYKQIHEEAKERLRALTVVDLDREMPFFGTSCCSIRSIIEGSSPFLFGWRAVSFLQYSVRLASNHHPSAQRRQKP